jgi:hypothetical protein
MDDEVIYIKAEDTWDMICPFNLTVNEEGEPFYCKGPKCMAWIFKKHGSSFGRCGRVNAGLHLCQ